MISEFNRVQFLYVFDFGYDGLMRMEALPAFQSFNRLYFESGYLSVFLTTNEIEF